MTDSPLSTPIAFMLGPVPVATPVVVTWGIVLALVATTALLTFRLRPHPGTAQTVMELVVSTLDAQIEATIQGDPAPYRVLVGTLFLFILTANWVSIIPGVDPPTAHLETDAALAFVVFVATICYGVKSKGVVGYLKTFAEPILGDDPAEHPANSLTRIFSLIVRLFGNVMSGVFVDWHRRFAGGPAGADPADGARSADRAGAGLHLRGAGDGVHHLGGRGRHGTTRLPTLPLQQERNHDGLSRAWPASSAPPSPWPSARIGPALAEGRAVAAAMDAIARQPEAANTISRTLFVGLAMIETTAIYCLVIALLLLFANPFVV